MRTASTLRKGAGWRSFKVEARAACQRRVEVVAGGEGRSFVWSEPFDVEVGESVQGIVLTLPQPARIEGTLELPAHFPPDDGVIQAVYPQGISGLSSVSDMGTMDAEGHFIFSELAPGSVELNEGCVVARSFTVSSP